MMRLITLILALGLTLSLSANAAEAHSQDRLEVSKTLVLIRHAEKSAGEDKDPSLSPAGKRRSERLVNKLKNYRFSQLLASPFKRTQETLLPISEALGIPITVIDIKSGLEAHITATINTVEAQAGDVLIAGHSNTVPKIISALGGPKIDDLDENQYSNIYELKIYSSGKVEFTQLE
ncbi:histidine phosphatase family protein [Shewanella benthica]|uniref:SixA phosphatase family protein n=1 Tax=Shewanella benthica TaxID=43661 RepID=UPI00187B0312|nr:phosphoglycerate mutase family protein [Shewanella benthica]MBE7213649.1 histidine phosphatase family protein [Shewanella benthica]MCL1060919.1 histidine phosphatase family protein [Shewanella benthica]